MGNPTGGEGKGILEAKKPNVHPHYVLKKIYKKNQKNKKGIKHVQYFVTKLCAYLLMRNASMPFDAHTIHPGSGRIFFESEFIHQLST